MTKDNILVIEGNRVLRTRVASALTEADFRVTTASDYLEGLLVLNELKPNLDIVGEELPLVDSWEACYQLHRAFNIPVILMGNDPSGQSWMRAIKVGVDFYIVKPFSYPELVARVNGILRQYTRTAR